jgi:hypothetical protein
MVYPNPGASGIMKSNLYATKKPVGRVAIPPVAGELPDTYLNGEAHQKAKKTKDPYRIAEGILRARWCAK